MRGGKRENSGKKKGSQNKTTKAIRNLFQEILENNFSKIQTDLDQMKPGQRVKTLIELSKFVILTLKATEISGSNEKTIEISFVD